MKGKAAIITGSTSGIGRAIAMRLAQEGVNITINYSTTKELAIETKKEIEALGVDCIIFQGSVANKEVAEELVQKTIGKFKRLDILVNNAGTTNFVAHDNLDGLIEEYWDSVMNVNVKGMFFCCRAAAKELRKQNGCIVNITSVAGKTALGSSIAYAASKAAGNSLTKSLARVLGPEIRVNAVAPGVVATRWFSGKENLVEEYSKGTPLGRIATPEDIADVTYSLIKHASFVTGEIVTVDGGAFI